MANVGQFGIDAAVSDARAASVARETAAKLADLVDGGREDGRPARSGVAGVWNPWTPPGKDGSGGVETLTER